jgi:hypothetical protein
MKYIYQLGLAFATGAAIATVAKKIKQAQPLRVPPVIPTPKPSPRWYPPKP